MFPLSSDQSLLPWVLGYQFVKNLPEISGIKIYELILCRLPIKVRTMLMPVLAVTESTLEAHTSILKSQILSKTLEDIQYNECAIFEMVFLSWCGHQKFSFS